MGLFLFGCTPVLAEVFAAIMIVVGLIFGAGHALHYMLDTTGHLLFG